MKKRRCKIIAIVLFLALLLVSCSNGTDTDDSSSIPWSCPPALNIGDVYYYASFDGMGVGLPAEAECVAQLKSICDMSQMPDEGGVNFPKFEIGDDIYFCDGIYYMHDDALRGYWRFTKPE